MEAHQTCFMEPPGQNRPIVNGPPHCLDDWKPPDGTEWRHEQETNGKLGHGTLMVNDYQNSKRLSDLAQNILRLRSSSAVSCRVLSYGAFMVQKWSKTIPLPIQWLARDHDLRHLKCESSLKSMPLCCKKGAQIQLSKIRTRKSPTH